MIVALHFIEITENKKRCDIWFDLRKNFTYRLILSFNEINKLICASITQLSLPYINKY